MMSIHTGTVQRPEKTALEYTNTLRTGQLHTASKSSANDRHDLKSDETRRAEDLLNLGKLSKEEQEQLQKELDKHNAAFSYTGKYLKFKFDEEAEMSYVEVIDSATNEVIVSLPPEFLIDLSVKLKKILGLVIDEKL